MKIKKPIIKVTLDDYNGEIKTTDFSEIIEYVQIKDNELLNKEDYRIVFDTVKFDKVTFNNNVFQRSEFIDCVFNNCDLSNNAFNNCTFIRCEFINTRLIGSHFVESSLTDIFIKGCNGNYLDVANSKLKNIKFKDTLLNESTFYTNEVKGLEFEDVKLEKTQFFETLLKDVDLRSCDIYNLKTDLKSIKGTIITSYQAREVCHLLGIKVED